RNNAIGCPGAVSSELHLRNARIITPRSCCGSFSILPNRGPIVRKSRLGEGQNWAIFWRCRRGARSVRLRQFELQIRSSLRAGLACSLAAWFATQILLSALLPQGRHRRIVL